MFGIQLLSITFIALMLYVVRIHYKKQELSKFETTFWTLALICLAVIVTVERTAEFVRDLFAVTRLMDVIVIFALMGTFVLLINNRIELTKLKRKLERIVRDRAIEDH